MAELLVTGGAGFIGANFVHYWRGPPRRHGITVLDALTYAGNLRQSRNRGLESALRLSRARYLRYRAGRKAAARARYRHAGPLRGREPCRPLDHGPDAFIDTNVVGTHSLLKAARSVWLGKPVQPHRFHHVSTDEVYGSARRRPIRAFSETRPTPPIRPIRRPRRRRTIWCAPITTPTGCDVTTSNCSNNYGPYQFPKS
jgi:dTDP-glucose 4,6-dehydratase